MFRITCIVLISIIVSACGGGSSEPSTPTDPIGGSGNISLTLSHNGSELPTLCQFSQNQLRALAPACNLAFNISHTGTLANDASVVGQFSTDNGLSWSGVSTTNDFTFTLNVASVQGAIQLRGLAQQGAEQFVSPVINLTIQANQVALDDALGSFTQQAVLAITPQQETFNLSLPACIDPDGDETEVEVLRNSALWFVQKPQAELILQANTVTDSMVIHARCRDILPAAVSHHEVTANATGSLIIAKTSTTTPQNTPPVLEILPLTAQRFSGAIRDEQTLLPCLSYFDANGDTLTANLSYQLNNGEEQPLVLSDKCASLSVDDWGGQRLTLIARVSDLDSTTMLTRDLGVIHADTIQQATGNNSQCTVGESSQTVSVQIPQDKEYDAFNLQIVDANSGAITQTLGQLTETTIALPCQTLGQTQYYIRNLSRERVQDSVLYSHTVNEIANNPPVVTITLPETEALVGLAYRDNQTLKACVNATDVEGAVLSQTLVYQFASEPLVMLNLLNNCADISTQGRGGQKLTLIATASDGELQVTESRSLGVIHSDTIQFPTSLSGSCVINSGDKTYAATVANDSEGDAHALRVVNSDTASLIATLGAVTNGSFSLPCNTLGTTRFTLLNSSRGLIVNSIDYSHTVIEAPNQAPTLSVSVTGEQFNEQFRDQQNLTVCFTPDDPENQPFTLNTFYRFSGDAAVQFLTLDNDFCGQISTLNRGNQTLTIQAEINDGVVTTSLDAESANFGVIYLDTVQTAFTSSNSCFTGAGSLTYTVLIPDDIEGDAIDLSVFDSADNRLISALGATAPFSFSLSCADVSERSFYIVNRSRNIGSFSLNHTHTVKAAINNAPTLAITLNGAEMFEAQVRDNQDFEVCLTASDIDGDNLVVSASYQVDGGAEQALNLNNFCADMSTQGLGGKTLTLLAQVNDGIETVTQTVDLSIHRDTLQFAYTSSQSCRIGDSNRIYAVTVEPDVENDETDIQVINADTGDILFDFNNTTASNFGMSCSSAREINFYISNTSRGISSRSITYQHLVSNTVNNQPSINLSLTTPELFSGQLRDNQIIEVCATVSDDDVNNTPTSDVLTTQIYYQFNSETEQQVSLNANLCGEIDLTNQGNKSLVLQGFVSDGTATTNSTLTQRVHLDSLNVAVSSSGSCRVGDEPRLYSVSIAGDAEGDIYSVDVYDENTDEILASLGQLTAGNFSLSCAEANAINFAIRTTGRGQITQSLLYSHVVTDTLNSAPNATVNIQSAEIFNEQVRDNQNVALCFVGTDPDNDATSIRASYRFDDGAFTQLSLNSSRCGSINTTGQGGNILVLQVFVDDGQIETTVFESLGEIHTDTIQAPVTVSSECTLNEPALRYAVLVPADTEGDAHHLQVYNSKTNDLIADLGVEAQSEFTLDCSELGITEFEIVNDSRGIQTTSSGFTHKVNASLTNTVSYWLTQGDQSVLLSQQDDQALRIGAGNAPLQIDVTDEITYQTLEHFGVNLSDTSAALIQNSTSTNSLLTQLFNADTGIGISGLRYHMSGMSSYVSRVANSYNDRPAGLTDPDLDFFSIQADEDFLLPTLQGILAENPNVHTTAVNWSAPAWMKDSSSLQGGSLRTDFYASYANYFLKFIEAYDALDINFDGISLQNQPHTVGDYPSMSWTADNYTDFLINHLESTLRQNSYNLDYQIWDGNWTDNNSQLPADIGLLVNTVLSNTDTERFVKATAWQCYAADNGVDDYSQAFDAMVSNSQKIYLTDCINQDDGRTFAQVLSQDVGDLFIGALHKSVNAIYYGLLALDTNNGPHQGGCDNCRALLTLDNSVTFNAEYYALAHFSQFIKPGAVRIDAQSVADQLETVAFKNTDNTVVVVAVNRTDAELSFDLNWQGQFFNTVLAANSVATFSWSADNAPIANAQQVAQASEIASDTYDFIASMRDGSTGLYREYYDLNGDQTADLSLRSTGFGLVALAIAHEMEWTNTARADALATINALNGQNPNITLDRNSAGFYRDHIQNDGTFIGADEFSVTATSQLVAGAIFVRNVIGGIDLIEAVDTLLGSIRWQSIVVNSNTGSIAVTQDVDAGVLSEQLPYNSQMLSVWFANKAGETTAQTVWENHYSSGEVFERYVYDGFNMPADENSNPISATIQQQNFYLIQDALSSANYRTLLREQAFAEKAFWQNNFVEASHIWGFGYGENSFASADPHMDSLVLHPGNIAHAPTIAGAIVTDITQLEDFLIWQDLATGAITHQTTLATIPWRFSEQDPTWQATRVELDGLITQLMGLASHPGLLDIGFFRVNARYPTVLLN
ncbi:glycoside hydrolase family 30 protein [Algibacillus agarilyticus]|uniref:glycoside hydrolase family 30 protein n=1 Tax=Algibacillus agarilyticus TaxID=2234133 RepID=UPI000DD04927|nr:glycoside hydrolase family 30 beta sandwich domain-containing protein [Algibacillus agarilyticus]